MEKGMEKEKKTQQQQSVLSFYMLTTLHHQTKSSYKFGYHTGSEKKLKKRYITSIPDLVICWMFPHEHAKHIEGLLKKKFVNNRMLNEGNHRSEWLVCNLEHMKSLVERTGNFLNEFFSKDCGQVPVLVPVLSEEVSNSKNSKKRKRKSLAVVSLLGSEQALVNEEVKEVIVANEANFSQLSQFFPAGHHGQDDAITDGVRKRMDFQDPRVKDEFVKYVLGLQDPLCEKDTPLTKDFLDRFLAIIVEHEQSPNKFSISLTSGSAWLKMQKKNFKRYIDTAYAQDQKPTGFVEGKNFIYLSRKDRQNKDQDELFMTLDTFQKAAGRTRGDFGKQVERYVWLVEKALRDWFGSSVREKYERYPYKEVKGVNKVIVPKGIKLSQGVGNYTIEFQYKGQAYYYDGITDDIRARLQNHAVELPVGCDVTLVSWTLNNSAKLVEVCKERVGKNIVVPVPEALRGMRNLYYKKSQLWKEVNEKCNAVGREVDAYHPPHDVEPRVLDSPDMYPVKKSKDYPRQKAHSWLDQPVAHYSTDPTTGRLTGSLVSNKKNQKTAGFRIS